MPLTATDKKFLMMSNLVYGLTHQLANIRAHAFDRPGRGMKPWEKPDMPVFLVRDFDGSCFVHWASLGEVGPETAVVTAEITRQMTAPELQNVAHQMVEKLFAQ